MKIEIDTKHDTKQDLAHLANMLNALTAGHSIIDNRFDRKLERKLARRNKIERKPVDLFENSSENSGFVNIFGDTSQVTSPTAEPVSSVLPSAPEPVAPSAGTGDIFSIFGGTDTPSAPNEPASVPDVPSVETYGGVNVPESKEEDSDVLKDIRVVPY